MIEELGQCEALEEEHITLERAEIDSSSNVKGGDISK